MPAPFLAAIMGPTASGKSDLAEALADEFDAALMNADAFQVYRGMDIGTGKSARRSEYDLLDVITPADSFGVGEFVLRARSLLENYFAAERSVILVGGTGLYVRALFEEYQDLAPAPDPALRARLDGLPLVVKQNELKHIDPGAAQKVDLANPVRVQRALERALTSDPSLSWRLPEFKRHKFALVPTPSETENRIARRVESMVHNGWVQEVEKLLGDGYGPDDPGFRAIGYRTLGRLLRGEIEEEEALATTITDTRSYAKRQRTWLRSEPNLTTLDLSEPYAHARRHLAAR